MTRLLALFEDPDGPSARLRFDLYCGGLERLGVEVRREGIPRGWRRRYRLFRRAESAEVTYVQRRLIPAWQVRLLRRRARRLVFDLDDAVGFRDRPPFRSRTRTRRLGAWLRAADHVVVGSPALLDHGGEARAPRTLVPTTVPAVDDPGVPEPGRVLWVGQPSTFRYLEALAPFLEEAARRDPTLHWVFLGASEGGLAGLPRAERPRWTPERELQELRRAAVGLAPLPDDPWTRGKCAARLHRYLSHGIPVVASPVGAQRAVAEACSGVRLAEVPSDWTGAIAEAALSAPERSAVRSSWGRRYDPVHWEATWLQAVLGVEGFEALKDRACAASE